MQVVSVFATCIGLEAQSRESAERARRVRGACDGRTRAGKGACGGLGRHSVLGGPEPMAVHVHGTDPATVFTTIEKLGTGCALPASEPAHHVHAARSEPCMRRATGRPEKWWP